MGENDRHPEKPRKPRDPSNRKPPQKSLHTPQQTPGQPGADLNTYDRSDIRVRRLLERHKSVGIVALHMGIDASSLSARLQGKRLREWWKATKAKWKRERHAASVARWRKKARARTDLRRAWDVLVRHRHPSQWTPGDVRLLLKAEVITPEQAGLLAQARAAGPEALAWVDANMALNVSRLQQASAGYTVPDPDLSTGY